MFQFNMNIFVIGAKLTEISPGNEINISKNKKKDSIQNSTFWEKKTLFPQFLVLRKYIWQAVRYVYKEPENVYI